MPAWSLLAWLPLAGLALWLAFAGSRLPELGDEATLAEVIVLFVPLVAAPLVLPLTAQMYRSSAPGSRRQVRRDRLLAGAGALGGAALVLGGLTPGLGRASAIAACAPWLGFCGLAAFRGLGRLLARGRLSAAELAIDLGHLFLPGAALWLLVYRGDLVLGGFGGLAALLTAGHFHAAGFGTLMMVGLLGRGLAEAQVGWARRLFPWLAGALMLAFPLLAVGIGSGVRAIEVSGATIYVVALPVLALLQVVAARRLRGRPIGPRVLLAMSAGALVLSTTLAGRFALQGFYGAAVPILTMLRLHALVNALGFLGLGLLAWSRLQPAPLAGPAGIPFSRLRSGGPREIDHAIEARGG